MTKGKRLDAGDVVRLNSGGPDMTVDTVFADGWVRCVWGQADDGSYRHSRHFRVETVTLIREAMTAIGDGPK